MMDPSLSELLSVASDAIGMPLALSVLTESLSKWGMRGKELAALLGQRNGFYAFESALLVRPLRQKMHPLGIFEWNVADLWKSEYSENLADVLFFAEDIFGGQICIRGDIICAFEPETGSFEEMSCSISEWASDLMNDYEVRTGYQLAHAWQIENALLSPGLRLLPKTPFVCGGRYEVDNLYSLDEVKGMQFRASIANQLHDIPDGAQIILNLETGDRKQQRTGKG